MKNIRTISDDMTAKLADFVDADEPVDSRVTLPKKPEKRKSRKTKLFERAKRKRKLMSEILDEKMETEPNNNEGKIRYIWYN